MSSRKTIYNRILNVISSANANAPSRRSGTASSTKNAELRMAIQNSWLAKISQKFCTPRQLAAESAAYFVKAKLKESRA